MTILLKAINAFRPVNFLIIVLLEYLLHQHLLLYVLSKENIKPELNHFFLAIIMLFSVLLTASGYLINDIKDYSIDKINKTGQNQVDYIGGMRKAVMVYTIQTIISLLLAAYLAYSLGKWQFFWLAPVMIFFLWLYSVKMKNHFFWGNFGVSLFAIMVILLIWFSETKSLHSLTEEINFLFIRNIFLCYGIFAFFTTWARELIKDAEDLKGDYIANLKTYPIKFGLKSTNKFIALLTVTIIVLIILIFSLNMQNFSNFQIIFGCFGIFLPATMILGFTFKANKKSDYSKMSRLMKLVMVGGIIFLLTLN